MFCPTCQHDNVEGAPFCTECGTRLGQLPAMNGTPTGALPQQTVLQDRYVIAQKLGQGGMGAVYRASDRRLSTVNWAIKEMSQSAITSTLERQQTRDAFRHEAEMLAALNHPHLPRVTDHFDQDGKSYLVMEYVPGETLLSLLQRTGLPQPQAQVFEWARQLCDVLDYLHSQDPPIIFRDLKPANIMLTPSGQVKLIDFGIARLFKPGQTKDTQAFGTAGYSAPEQYGRGQTDARSDVYSLGVLLHQLLTGYDPTNTPFRLPSARQLNPNVSRQISDALAAATNNDADQRFATIRMFQAALFDTTGTPARIDSQPFGQAQSTPTYARPNSQPFAQPGSQPYSQPYTASGAATQTASLANASRWTGIASVVVMGIAALIVAGAGARGVKSAAAGAAYILAFLPLVSGPVALIMGIIALVGVNTTQAPSGRRYAIIGIATGATTLLLCCMIALMVGSFSSER